MNLGNCDVCGRELQGYTSINGMKFCAKCYHETFGQPTNNCLYCAFKSADEKIKTNSIKGFEKLKKENKQLKDQLAKKDKEFIIYLGDIKQHLGANIVERYGYDMILIDYQDAFHFIDRIISKIEKGEKKQ